MTGIPGSKNRKKGIINKRQVLSRVSRGLDLSMRRKHRAGGGDFMSFNN